MTETRFIITVTIAGAALALGACDATSNSDDDGGTPTSATAAMSDTMDDPTGGEAETGEASGESGGSGGPTTMPTTDPTAEETGTPDTGIDPDPQNVVDDLEDGDPLIYPGDGRQGAWYTYNDESMGGVQTPAGDEPFAPVEGGPMPSLYMAHTDGSGFGVWGAGLGFDLNNEGDDMGGPGVRNPYDGSGFTGIGFMARGTPFRLKVLVEAIVPTATGGTCESMTDCEDAHGKVIPVTEEWAQYTVPFDELRQEGWGVAAEFDPATLMAVQFQVAANTDFDFDIDEVFFY
jgi:hypothetical protein